MKVHSPQILMSAPMVLALLREARQPGTGKTQTRRLAWKPPKSYPGVPCEHGYDACPKCDATRPTTWKRLYGAQAAGEEQDVKAWVKETWAPLDRLAHSDPGTAALAAGGFYRADGGTVDGEISRWTPSILMPKWASRLTLEVSWLRLERLQDISREDAIAEGLSCLSKDDGRTWKYGIPDRDGQPGNDDLGWHWDEWSTNPVSAYRRLWEKLHGPGSWEANPEVVVVDFAPRLCNIEAINRSRRGVAA